MKTTIDIPDALYKQAKIRAIEQGQTLKQIVLKSLEKELNPSATATPPASSYWANRKLLPEFARLQAQGAFKPKPGYRSIDEILDDVRADSSA